MEVAIELVGDISSEDSMALRRLAELVENDCELSVDIERAPVQPGTKDGGLAIGIAIASLTVASLETLFTAITYWKSRNPKYSISVKRDDVTEAIENLDFEQYQKEYGKLSQDSRVQIDIKREKA